MAPPHTASPGEMKSTAQIPSPTISVTAPSLVKRADHALTTPYVFPPECTFNYAMVSSTAAISDSFGHAEETFLYCPIGNNDLWSSCQPTGAVNGYQQDGPRIVRPESVYRGAVCPSGWVAFEVGMASRTPIHAVYPEGKDGYWTTLAPETWSTARCCKSGDTFGKNYWGLILQLKPFVGHDSLCISAFAGGGTIFSSYVVQGVTSFEPYDFTHTHTEDGTTSTDSGIYTPVQNTQLTIPFNRGRAFYAAMSMEWNEEENKTLEPKWPTLTSDMLIPTWTPGAEISNRLGDLDNRGRGRRDAPPPSTPNKVAIPVIATLAALLAISLGALLFMLWRGWKAKRQVKGSHKIVDDNLVGVPMDGEAGSTAHLNGQAGDDMELRERDVAR